MSGRWHRHLMWSCEPQENTLPCVWWVNPLTPYKHCHTGSAHPGRTEVIDLLSSTHQQAQAVTHPSTKRDQYCLTSWVIIYYMSHTIDKWNLYWSYTIKCIFAGIKISRFDSRSKKKIAPQRHFFSEMLKRTKNVNLFGLIKPKYSQI